jgi:multidrug resistance efflux pump
MKRTIPALAVLSFIFAVFYTYSARPVQGRSTPPQPPPQAASGNTVAAEGLVEPEYENILLSTPVPGLVTGLYVKTGDRVRAGQPLFSLDDRDLQADLSVRRATLAATRARLEKAEQSPRPEEVPPAQAKVDEANALLADAKVQVQLIEAVTDKRAVRDEDVRRRRLNLQAAEARVKEAETELALVKAGTWSADLAIAKAEVEQACAAARQDEINIGRLTIRAPMDGVILQNKVRLGQYAAVGQIAEPLMIFGAGKGIHARASVDESDAWRVREGASAVARLRGNSRISFPLEFVRFEPYVVPKKSLTGDATERVDTRALEVIYRFRDPQAHVFDGQQLDIFIDAAAPATEGGASHEKSGR